MVGASAANVIAYKVTSWPAAPMLTAAISQAAAGRQQNETVSP